MYHSTKNRTLRGDIVFNTHDSLLLNIIHDLLSNIDAANYNDTNCGKISDNILNVIALAEEKQYFESLLLLDTVYDTIFALLQSNTTIPPITAFQYKKLNSHSTSEAISAQSRKLVEALSGKAKTLFDNQNEISLTQFEFTAYLAFLKFFCLMEQGRIFKSFLFYDAAYFTYQTADQMINYMEEQITTMWLAHNTAIDSSLYFLGHPLKQLKATKPYQYLRNLCLAQNTIILYELHHLNLYHGTLPLTNRFRQEFYSSVTKIKNIAGTIESLYNERAPFHMDHFFFPLKTQITYTTIANFQHIMSQYVLDFILYMMQDPQNSYTRKIFEYLSTLIINHFSFSTWFHKQNISPHLKEYVFNDIYVAHYFYLELCDKYDAEQLMKMITEINHANAVLQYKYQDLISSDISRNRIQTENNNTISNQEIFLQHVLDICINKKLLKFFITQNFAHRTEVLDVLPNSISLHVIEDSNAALESKKESYIDLLEQMYNGFILQQQLYDSLLICDINYMSSQHGRRDIKEILQTLLSIMTSNDSDLISTETLGSQFRLLRQALTTADLHEENELTDSAIKNNFLRRDSEINPGTMIALATEGEQQSQSRKSFGVTKIYTKIKSMFSRSTKITSKDSTMTLENNQHACILKDCYDLLDYYSNMILVQLDPKNETFKHKQVVFLHYQNTLNQLITQTDYFLMQQKIRCVRSNTAIADSYVYLELVNLLLKLATMSYSKTLNAVNMMLAWESFMMNFDHQHPIYQSMLDRAQRFYNAHTPLSSYQSILHNVFCNIALQTNNFSYLSYLEDERHTQDLFLHLSQLVAERTLDHHSIYATQWIKILLKYRTLNSFIANANEINIKYFLNALYTTLTQKMSEYVELSEQTFLQSQKEIFESRTNHFYDNKNILFHLIKDYKASQNNIWGSKHFNSIGDAFFFFLDKIKQRPDLISIYNTNNLQKNFIFYTFAALENKDINQQEKIVAAISQDVISDNQLYQCLIKLFKIMKCNQAFNQLLHDHKNPANFINTKIKSYLEEYAWQPIESHTGLNTIIFTLLQNTDASIILSIRDVQEIYNTQSKNHIVSLYVANIVHEMIFTLQSHMIIEIMRDRQYEESKEDDTQSNIFNQSSETMITHPTLQSTMLQNALFHLNDIIKNAIEQIKDYARQLENSTNSVQDRFIDILACMHFATIHLYDLMRKLNTDHKENKDFSMIIQQQITDSIDKSIKWINLHQDILKTKFPSIMESILKVADELHIGYHSSTQPTNTLFTVYLNKIVEILGEDAFIDMQEFTLSPIAGQEFSQLAQTRSIHLDHHLQKNYIAPVHSVKDQLQALQQIANQYNQQPINTGAKDDLSMIPDNALEYYDSDDETCNEHYSACSPQKIRQLELLKSSDLRLSTTITPLINTENREDTRDMLSDKNVMLSSDTLLEKKYDTAHDGRPNSQCFVVSCTYDNPLLNNIIGVKNLDLLSSILPLHNSNPAHILNSASIQLQEKTPVNAATTTADVQHVSGFFNKQWSLFKVLPHGSLKTAGDEKLTAQLAYYRQQMQAAEWQDFLSAHNNLLFPDIEYLGDEHNTSEDSTAYTNVFDISILSSFGVF